MAPKLAAFSDEVIQNGPLFKRIEAVHQGAEKLTPEQRRLTWLTYTNFVRSGARLEAAQKAGSASSTSAWPAWAPSSARTCWLTRPGPSPPSRKPRTWRVSPRT